MAEDVTAWRLFVSDHAKPVVHVIDAVDGDTLARFDIKGPASLYRSDSGEAVYAVQGDADVVTTIRTGIAFQDHGDHADIDIEDAALAGAEIAGDYPVHFVGHDGHWAAFFDKEGLARVFEEHEALEGHASFREVNSGAPHHGVVVPYGNFDLVSEPHPQDPSNLPIGIKTFDRDGNSVGDLAECPDLHGEATSGNQLAFACATGLLVVTPGPGGAPSIEHIAYSPALPEGKSTTLTGGRGLQYFLGNYGPSAVVLIDPSEEEAFRLVELPTRRVTFAVDPIRARFAYIFTEDGQLHQLDVIAGEVSKSLALTDPYSMDGHWSDPRPRVAVAGDHIVVTDPLAGKLLLVDAASFKKDGEIAVEGTPFNIVAVGGTGTAHEGHEHGDEAHDHGHDHDSQIYKGYFEDAQIAARALSDWEGDWQSVYPYLQDGTLDPVMEHKAESGEQTAEEYRAYYEIGYRTNVERITIEGDTVTFYEDGKPLAARYASDGYEVLTYAKGNRGVRFIFKKSAGEDAAPQFIQFSDHAIAPQDAGHYHLYWGDDRAALLEEVTHWPTYYPSSLGAGEIVDEMIAH
ncbi:zinc metallochaperone AztD [Devosia sp. LC5]|uniref:zinc metallochaperone AztD n=1 Tax=Devosia sp. LC5 TaxID=1502724 RepID=UPI00244E0284|nr:zinc metallochaperone AztD [Devosia sp. LC5]